MVWIIVITTFVIVYGIGKIKNPWLDKLFDWFPAILLAYVIPALWCWLCGLDFSKSDIHSLSKEYLIPLAIISVMSSLSLQQLKALGWKPIVLFFSGALTICLFPVLYMLLFRNSDFVSGYLIDQSYWKGLMPVIGDWIGGSTSQLVLKEIVECPEAIFIAIFIIDNVLVNIWTILMFQTIKGSNRLNDFLHIKGEELSIQLRAEHENPLPAWLCLLILCMSVSFMTFVDLSFVWKVIILSFMGLVISNTLARWNFGFVLKVAHVAILLVMIVLGLKLRFEQFSFDPALLGMLCVWLISHLIVMTVVAKLLKINFAWVPIASMANVGGIATAPAVTSAYRKEWMPYAILLAILSMVSGTFFGMIAIYLIQSLVL